MLEKHDLDLSLNACDSYARARIAFGDYKDAQVRISMAKRDGFFEKKRGLKVKHRDPCHIDASTQESLIDLIQPLNSACCVIDSNNVHGHSVAAFQRDLVTPCQMVQKAYIREVIPDFPACPIAIVEDAAAVKVCRKQPSPYKFPEPSNLSRAKYRAVRTSTRIRKVPRTRKFAEFESEKCRWARMDSFSSC